MIVKKYQTIIDALCDHAKIRPERLAFSAEGKTLNYEQLYQAVSGFAKYLVGAGFKKGGRVVMQTRQSLDLVVACLGTYMAGGIFAPIEKTSVLTDIEEYVTRTGAFLLISEKENAAIKWLDNSRVLETAGKHVLDPIEPVYPNAEDPAELLFTSGTTGRPKGVLSAHKNIVAAAENMITGTEYHEETLVLAPNPLNHANGIRKISAAVLFGSGVVILNGLTDFQCFFKTLSEMPITGLCLPTAMVHALLVVSKDMLGKYADKIEFVETSTAMLPEAEKERLCKLLPNSRLYNNYGMTEAATLCMYDYNRFNGLINCVGRASLNSQIIIVDEKKKEIASSKNNIGILAASGGTVMTGYWDDPELTARVLKDGYYYTSDLGYIESGFIYVVGRKDDLIHSGGYKVSPDEVEEAAMRCKGIKDCACTGVDDAHLGQATKLFVVVAEGFSFDEVGIRKDLCDILDPYKMPKYIVEAEKIPRAAIGKILRQQLV